MFYDIFYNFISTNVLGPTAMLTERAQLICEYSTYVLCFMTVITIISFAIKLGKALINCAR